MQRQRGFELTKSQHAELLLRYDMLRRDLAALLERTVNAFIQSNEIFPEDTDDDDSEAPELTQAELDEIDAMLKLAANIEPTAIHKGIEDQS